MAAQNVLAGDERVLVEIIEEVKEQNSRTDSYVSSPLIYCLYNSSSEIMSFTSSPYLLYKDTSQRFVSLQSRRCFLDRGSVGFSAVSGIAHDRPKRSAPGIRPSVQY